MNLLFKARSVSLFIGICLVLFLLPAGAYSATGRTIAENFLAYRNMVETIGAEQALTVDNVQVGTLVHLLPQGYLVVAESRQLPPVRAFGTTSHYEDLPPAYRQFLLDELAAATMADISVTDQSLLRRQPLDHTGADSPYSAAWELLLGTEPTQPSLRSSAYATVVDPLVKTKWGQGTPYNDLLPLANDGRRVLTGCVNTAFGMLMHYHRHPDRGRGYAIHQWNGQTLEAHFSRDYLWENMSAAPTLSDPSHHLTEIALLMRDLGIANQTDFGADESSTYFIYDSMWEYFGYSTQIFSVSNNNIQSFLGDLKSEIDAGRPVLLDMPNHLTLSDGYMEDPVLPTMIHINFGWSGHADDYFVPTSTINTDSYSFSPTLSIVGNIRPCNAAIAGDCYLPPNDPEADQTPLFWTEMPSELILSEQSPRKFRYLATSQSGEIFDLHPLISNNQFFDITIDDAFITLIPQSNGLGAFEIYLNNSGEVQNPVLTGQALVYDQPLDYGAEITVSGSFSENQSQIFEHPVFLEGNCTLSGHRGYSNQAFYLGVRSAETGAFIVEPKNEDWQHYFADPGQYTVTASLSHGGWYYNWDPDYASYTIDINCPDLTTTPEQLAALLNVPVDTTINDSQPLPLNGANLVVRILDDLNASISSLQQQVIGARLQQMLDAGTASNLQIALVLAANPQIRGSVPIGTNVALYLADRVGEVKNELLSEDQ